MRQTIKLLGFFAALCILVCMHAKKKPTTSPYPVLLQNIEALSAGEKEGTIYCYGTGTVICAKYGNKVKVSTILN